MAALLVMMGLSPLLAWARETQCMHTLGGELLWCGKRKSTLVYVQTMSLRDCDSNLQQTVPEYLTSLGQ